MTMSGIGTFLLVLFIIALFVGGCGALGWFVLPRLFGQEAILPLTIGSAVLGGIILSLLGWSIVKFSEETRPFITGRRYDRPYWEQEIDRVEKRYQNAVVWWRAGLCFVLVPILGFVGWKLGQDSAYLLVALGLLAGIGAVVLWQRFLNNSFITLLFVFLIATQGVITGLSWLLDKIRWTPDANVGAILGIVISPLLAYFLGKRLAGSPPNTWKMRQEALFLQVMQNPTSVRELDPWDQQIVLLELQKLAQAAPEAWKRLPLELQALIPSSEPPPPGQKSTSAGKRRAVRSSKPKTTVEESPPLQPSEKIFKEPQKGTVELKDQAAIVFCPIYYHGSDMGYSKDGWSIQKIYDQNGKLLKPVFKRTWTEIALGIATRNPHRNKSWRNNQELCEEAIRIAPEACPVRVVFEYVSRYTDYDDYSASSESTRTVEMIFQRSNKN